MRTFIPLFSFLMSISPLFSDTVNFVVEVPPNTPLQDTVFVMGNVPELGNWDPHAVPLERLDHYKWQTSINFSSGTTILYRYCRGSWATLEMGLYGEQISTRNLTVNGDTALYDTILSWKDVPHPFPREPYLSWVMDPYHSVTLSLERPEPCTLFVDFGLSPAYGSTVTDTTFTAKHIVTLEGLQPGSLYHYRVRTSTGYISGDHTFKTAPLTGNFVIAAFGDNRSDSLAHQEVVNAMLTYTPDFVLNTGDLVYDGKEITQWNTFFNIEKNLMANSPYMPVVGNHEDPEDEECKFYYLFELPGNEKWYSFDYENVHFIGLDTETNLYGEQRTWLINDLQEVSQNPDIDWKIVFLHRPPYSSGSHGSQMDVRNAWCPLFEEYGVDLVFAGHDHDYERTIPINGVIYIVTGGGGAPLYGVGHSSWTAYSESTHHFVLVSVEEDTLSLQAIRSNNTLMDTLTLYRICGDINNDGSITISDVLYLANYLFGGGPPPLHISTSDVNGDGTVDFSDLTYLMNYLVGGGPPPECW